MDIRKRLGAEETRTKKELRNKERKKKKAPRAVICIHDEINNSRRFHRVL
jgi:hypothetical protein